MKWTASGSRDPDGRADCFNEMLERTRDIRASEKRFDQKVRDLFALNVDCDNTGCATGDFCGHRPKSQN